MTRLLGPAVLLCAIACASAPSPQIAGVPTIYDAQRRIEQYVADGRYDKDVAKVVDGARAWMEQRSKAVAKPAIVLDIDETSLTNWPAYKINGWVYIANGECDLKQAPCGFRAWQSMGLAKAIVPTLDLARRARELGVAVFFITGRREEFRQATERNLKEQGYEWTGLILMPQNASFKSVADFKAPERRKLTEEGYTVLFTMGDQQSDLTGGYAERTFKLPNPVYYLP